MASKGVIQNRLSQPLGSKYLSATDHTEVNCTEFVAQEDTIITLLEGGDASVAATDVDYKSSMNLEGVTLKKGALIVSPTGEAFQNINISEGSALAYNSVFKGEKPSSFVGLLDLYPNAAAAYSLRKLRAAYVGSAIRVRRSSDNTEQDIGFVDNELDTASLLAFVGAGDGFVTTWYDQSGGGNNDAAQVTESSQPKIVSSGAIVGTINSNPLIEWDGSNDFIPFNPTLLNSSTKFTLNVWSKSNGVDSTFMLAHSTSVSNRVQVDLQEISTDARVFLRSNSSNLTTANGAFVAGESMITLTFDGGLAEEERGKLYINGSFVTNCSTPMIQVPNNLYFEMGRINVGATYNSKTISNECLIYNNEVLTASEITAIYNYI